MKDAALIAPYSGELINIVVSGEERSELLKRTQELPSIQLSARSLCDLELLATGAFSPLAGFLGPADYTRVLDEMRLADGTLFPIPVTLPVSDKASIRAGQEIALRSSTNLLIGWMRVEEMYEWDRCREAMQVYGTNDDQHPLVAEMASWGNRYISGTIKVINLPKHHDFPELRRTPAEARRLLKALGRSQVVAFHTHSPLYRNHEEFTKYAAAQAEATLLLHPVVGLATPGDMDHYARIRTYKLLVEKYYDPARTLLSLLPLAMRLAGPKEAVWHAIIRRNYGAAHFIVGRDYASPGNDSAGKPFYGALEAQEMFAKHSAELGVEMIPSDLFDHPEAEDRSRKTFAVGGDGVGMAGPSNHNPLQEYSTRPEIAAILTSSFPPRHKQGFCIWFTGLPSAGKSTIAEVLANVLMEYGRQVTLLDGDVVRTHLSKGLGFSKEDRDTNIRRIGFVASEIVRHGGAVICAAVSPYRAARTQVRNMVGAEGFIETFIDTPLKVCEQRDVKGFYAKAKAGEIRGFTGVDDPYEPPLSPEILLGTTNITPEENARKIVQYLLEKGFLLEDSQLASAMVKSSLEFAVT